MKFASLLDVIIGEPRNVIAISIPNPIYVMFPFVGTTFSPDMTPDQLEQWLLQEYGEAYKHEISKLKGIRDLH